MRLIDADALKDALKIRIEAARNWYHDATTVESRVRAEQAISTFLEVVLTVNGMPTIREEDENEE